MILSLFLSLCGCSWNFTKDQISEDPKENTKTAFKLDRTIEIDSDSNLSVNEAKSLIERSWYTSKKIPLQSIFEASSSVDSSGSYNIKEGSISIDDLISDLNSQLPGYTWKFEVINDKYFVIIKPSNNSFLDRTTTGEYDAINQKACTILKEISSNVFDKKPAFGCAIRSKPRFISPYDAVQLDKAKISLSLGDKTSIEDAVKAVLLNLDSRIGLSLYQMAPHMPPIWEPSW